MEGVTSGENGLNQDSQVRCVKQSCHILGVRPLSLSLSLSHTHTHTHTHILMSATPGSKERTLETLEPPSLFLLCHTPLGGTLPHPIEDTLPHPTGGTLPHPTGGTLPHPIEDTLPHPTGGTLPHPTGDTLPHPTGDTLPHPTGGTLPHPTGDTLPHPTGDTLPHPTRGGREAAQPCGFPTSSIYGTETDGRVKSDADGGTDRLPAVMPQIAALLTFSLSSVIPVDIS